MFNDNFYAGNCGKDPDAGYDFPDGPTPEEEAYIDMACDYNYVIEVLQGSLLDITDCDEEILQRVKDDLERMKYSLVDILGI